MGRAGTAITGNDRLLDNIRVTSYVIFFCQCIICAYMPMEMSAEVNFGDKLTRDVLPGLFVTGEGLIGRWSGTMCDSCNTKINLISRKVSCEAQSTAP